MMKKILLTASVLSVVMMSSVANAQMSNSYNGANYRYVPAQNYAPRTVQNQYEQERLVRPYLSAKYRYAPNTEVSIGSDSEKIDNGHGGSLAFGVAISNARFELEYNRNLDLEENYGSTKWTLENQSLMLNMYVDIITKTSLTPYIGGGVGVSKRKLTASAYGRSEEFLNKEALAWQVGGGFAWAINDNVALDIGYRYTDYGEADGDYATDIGTTAHEVYVGARYTF